MQVAFFDPAVETLTSQRKGALFEALTARLAAIAGYEAVKLRQKHNSLEYDVEGRSRLHGTRLVGEAKAHARAIDGKEVAAFVGKLVPLGITERVDGLFVSTSAFTPDALDYLSEAQAKLRSPQLQLGLKTLVGDEIPNFFVQHSGYASESVLRSRVASGFDMELLDSWLVVTERGDLFVCSCGPNTVSAATGFVAFRTDGVSLRLDEDARDRLETQLPDVRNLEQMSEGERTLFVDRVERLPKPAVGAGWFDYRFPAPPDCFIGRSDPLGSAARVGDT